VYDSGEEDGNLYIAMRLVEGTNLAELLQTRGLTADGTIELLRPIAGGARCRSCGGPDPPRYQAAEHPYHVGRRIRISRFRCREGVEHGGLTATGGFVGSVNYASPEQIKGLTLTPASDIYALTGVLYPCLTRQVPFPRAKPEAGVMHAHLHDPPPTLPTATGADSDFHTVLRRGMAKDPGAATATLEIS